MIQNSTERNFIRAAMAAPYLEREEELLLAQKWRDQHDQASLHRMTIAHMRLVIAMAAKFRNYGLPVSDLIQEGHVGLMEAAMRFEPERDVRFSTYATWWIRASMQDYVLRNWSIVRGGTSSAQKALFFNLRRLRARLSAGSDTLSSTALYREIASALHVSVEDVATMDCRLSASDNSLNAPLSGEADSMERMDYLVCEAPLPDEVATQSIDVERRNIWLKDALGALNPRELHIIEERRLKDESATLAELGEAMGISKERVRQIEVRAMQKLKVALVERHPEFIAA